MNIGDKIKNARLQKGMTQEELAKYICSTKQAIYKYENDVVTNIPFNKLELIAKALDVTICYLVEDGNKDDEWLSNFRKSLADELSVIDRADAQDSYVNIEKLESLSCGNTPVTLSEACTIADELGTSLDKMVGLRDIDETALEFLGLFSKLTDAQQDMIIASMKGILSNQ